MPLDEARIAPRDLGFIRILAGSRARYESLAIEGHVWKAWVCSIVVEGEVRSEGAVAGPGQVMVHAPKKPFYERAEGPGLHEWVAFRMEGWHPVWNGSMKGGVFPLSSVEEAASAYGKLLLASQSGTVTETSAAFLALLAQVEKGMSAPQASAPSSRFDSLVKHIKLNLDGDLSRECLAKIAGMHPNSLDRSFRKQLGVTPQELVRQKRTERIKHLLASTDLTLEDIALRTGLGSAAYLSRAFKAETSLTPSQYRRGVNKTNLGYYSAVDSADI